MLHDCLCGGSRASCVCKASTGVFDVLILENLGHRRLDDRTCTNGLRWKAMAFAPKHMRCRDCEATTAGQFSPTSGSECLAWRLAVHLGLLVMSRSKPLDSRFVASTRVLRRHLHLPVPVAEYFHWCTCKTQAALPPRLA